MYRLPRYNKIARVYELDLWNKILLKGKVNSLGLYFVKLHLNSLNEGQGSSFLKISENIMNTKKGRLSEYGEILRLRKKICYFYGGLSKRKYRFFNLLAYVKGGNYLKNLAELLELRLVSVTSRLHFCNNILEGHSLILSGFVLVNKKIVRSPHYLVKPGDVVELQDSLKSIKCVSFLKNVEEGFCCNFVSYLEFSSIAFIGMVVNTPDFSEIPFFFKVDRNLLRAEFVQKL